MRVRDLFYQKVSLLGETFFIRKGSWRSMKSETFFKRQLRQLGQLFKCNSNSSHTIKSIHLYTFYCNHLKISRLISCIDECIDDQLYMIVVSLCVSVSAAASLVANRNLFLSCWCLFRVVPPKGTSCFHGRNKLFPWEEHPLNCHRNNSKVPQEQVEEGIRMRMRCYLPSEKHQYIWLFPCFSVYLQRHDDNRECHSAVTAATSVVTAGISDRKGSLLPADRERRYRAKGKTGWCLVAAPCG